MKNKELEAKSGNNYAMLKMVMRVDKTIGYLQDIVTYQIATTNIGNIAAHHVTVSDFTPLGTVGVPELIKVNVPYTLLANGNIEILGKVEQGQMIAISVSVKILTIPKQNQIVNIASADYTDTIDTHNSADVSKTTYTNTVATSVFQNNFSRPITDLIQSVALEQAALAAIANAEGAKVQRMVIMPEITTEELLCLNQSVVKMVDAIILLEMILKQKLEVVDCQINGVIC